MESSTFNSTIYMNRAFEKSAQSSAIDYATTCVHHLAMVYKFNAEDALTMLNMGDVTVKKAASRKKGEGKPKSPKSAVPRVKRETPTFPIPWTGVANADWCNGIRLNHQLHTQCCMEPISDGMYCKTCQKQADTNANGIPTYGNVEGRLVVDILEFRDPKQNKQTIPYANVMEKLSITREAAESEAAKFGMTIPEEHFVLRESKRGRPKKDASTSDSDSDSSSSSSTVIAKKRGRPKKEKKVITACVGDDLIASLVANANTAAADSLTVTVSPTAVTDSLTAVTDSLTVVTDSPTAVVTVSPTAVVTVSPTAADKKKAKEDKAIAKAAKAAKRDAKMITLLTEYDALSVQLGGVSTPVPTTIGAFTKAIPALKRQLKEKVAADALKVPEEVIEAIIETDEDDDDEEEESSVEVTKFEFEEKSYLKSADNILYDATTQEQVGVWDPDTSTIQEIEQMDDEDEDEDDG
jgi:hypothetical protein